MSQFGLYNRNEEERLPVSLATAALGDIVESERAARRANPLMWMALRALVLRAVDLHHHVYSNGYLKPNELDTFIKIRKELDEALHRREESGRRHGDDRP